LTKAKQPFQAVGMPCISIAEIDKAEREADAQASAEADTAKRDAAGKAVLAREAALTSARDAADRHRENVMAIATL
ncbi:hypothetical protein ABTE00_22745, partial [Acinetobacter baumannii]